MRIAVAQMRSRSGDFENIRERMLRYARSAASKGVRLVVYPYALLTGTTGVDYPDRMSYVMDLVDTLDRLAKDAPCPLLVSVGADYNPFGTPVAVLLLDGDVRVLMGDSGIKGCQRGFVLDDIRFGVAYTYDELDALLFDDNDAQVALFVNSLGFAGDDPSSAMGLAVGEGTLRRDVGDAGLWLVGAASLGCYDTEVFVGSSFVLTPWGELAAQAPAFEESLLVADVDPASEGPLSEPVTPEVYDRLLTMWQALALGLVDTLAGEGVRDVALVLDGGLRSSVLCILAVDALGPTHVHALVVPQGSDELLRCAHELAAALRVDVHDLDEPLARSLTGDELGDFAAVRLAALARKVGAMPLSDVDKTTLALEADSAHVSVGGLAPLGDVYRTDAIDLARLRNTISPVIPQASLEAFDVPDVGVEITASSPEARLELIDASISGRIDWERAYGQVALGVGRPELVAAVLAEYRRHELGRADMPRVIRACARTLEEARRPLGSAWHDEKRSMAELESLADSLYERLGLDDESGERHDDASPSEDDQMSDARGEMEDMVKLLRDLAEQGGLISPEFLEGIASPDTGGHDGQRGQGRHGQQGQGFGWGNPFSEN